MILYEFGIIYFFILQIWFLMSVGMFIRYKVRHSFIALWGEEILDKTDCFIKRFFHNIFPILVFRQFWKIYFKLLTKYSFYDFSWNRYWQSRLWLLWSQQMRYRLWKSIVLKSPAVSVSINIGKTIHTAIESKNS